MSKQEMKEIMLAWAIEAKNASMVRNNRRLVVMKKTPHNMVLLAYCAKKGYTDQMGLNDKEVLVELKKHFVAIINKAVTKI